MERQQEVEYTIEGCNMQCAMGAIHDIELYKSDLIIARNLNERLLSIILITISIQC
jgi:hypothetical protein